MLDPCWRAIPAGNAHGTLGGIPADPATKVFNVCNSLGSVLFAFSFSQILIEIQVRDSTESKHRAAQALNSSPAETPRSCACTYRLYRTMSQ